MKIIAILKLIKFDLSVFSGPIEINYLLKLIKCKLIGMLANEIWEWKYFVEFV